MSGRPFRFILVVVLLLAGSVPVLRAQATFDGLVYAHFRYGLTTDSSLTPPANANNFDVNRVHLTWRSRSERGVSTRVTLDMDGRAASSNQLSMRVKFAHVSWQPEGSALTWKFGLQTVPIVSYIEDLYGYRMQGPVAIDAYGYQGSGDFGFAVEGAFKEQGVNFDAGVFNGEGFAGAPGDNRKDLAARVSVRLVETDNASKTGGLRLTGYASTGAPTGGGSRSRLLGMLSYQTNQLSAAVELGATVDSTATGIRTPGSFVSIWGAYQVVDSPWGLLLRLDRLDPNTDLAPATTNVAASVRTRTIAGVSYTLSNKLRFLVDADVSSLAGGSEPNAFAAANRTLFFHTEIKF